MQNNLKAAILAALLLAPAVSFAQEAATEEASSNFSWNAGVVTDYVFRGITQTEEGSAVQGGLDYSFGDSGFYIGTWGSNVSFAGSSIDAEMDTYIGYNHDFTENFNFDVMLNRYNYFGENAFEGNGVSDYNELIVKFAVANIATLTVGYTNDFAHTGENTLYTNIGNSWDLGSGYSLNAGFGRSYGEPFNGDYNDWNLGVSKAFGAFEFGLNYYDTNLDYDSSDSVVLSVKIGG